MQDFDNILVEFGAWALDDDTAEVRDFICNRYRRCAITHSYCVCVDDCEVNVFNT